MPINIHISYMHIFLLYFEIKLIFTKVVTSQNIYIFKHSYLNVNFHKYTVTITYLYLNDQLKQLVALAFTFFFSNFFSRNIILLEKIFSTLKEKKIIF